MSSAKPELCVDLNGSTLAWSEGKSSRKYVFQVSTVLGLQLLLQADAQDTSRDWFSSIDHAIHRLAETINQGSPFHSPHGEKPRKANLTRSKSTKGEFFFPPWGS
ncbi:unnamed protein product, partial [Darwinula stevensoni]